MCDQLASTLFIFLSLATRYTEPYRHPLELMRGTACVNS